MTAPFTPPDAWPTRIANPCHELGTQPYREYIKHTCRECGGDRRVPAVTPTWQDDPTDKETTT